MIVLLERLDGQQVRAEAGELLGVAERRRMQAVQERASGVGVDFDQARALRREMEVVAHEHAEVSGRMPQHRLRVGVEEGLIGGRMREPEQQRDGALDRREVLRLERDQRRGGVRNGVCAGCHR